MKYSPSQLINQRTGDTLATQILLADTHFSRLRGLLFRTPLEITETLHIIPCKQVHSHFMSYPLNLIFVDSKLTVVKVMVDFKPWKLSPWVTKASSILEFNAKTSLDVAIGDQLLMQ